MTIETEVKATKEQIANYNNPQWIKQQIEILTGLVNESYQTLIETKFDPIKVDWSKVVIDEKRIIVPLKK